MSMNHRNLLKLAREIDMLHQEAMQSPTMRSELSAYAKSLENKYAQEKDAYLSDEDKKKLMILIGWIRGLAGELSRALGGTSNIRIGVELYQRLQSTTPNVTVSEAKRTAQGIITTLQNIEKVQSAAQNVLSM